MIREAREAAGSSVPPQHRLVVVSNRLPIVLSRRPDGSLDLKRGSGGLVTAMEPILRDRGAMWIGWSGMTEEPPELPKVLARASRDAGYNLRALTLSEQERDQFYYGYSNEVLWPLFHDLQGQCNFDPEYEQAYVAVNRRYAELIRQACAPNDFIWIHDYQLMYVAQALQEDGCTDRRLAFFLHIPFPPLDIFVKLPARHRLLRAMLQHDLLGFQTGGDRRNFVNCVRRLIPEARTRSQGAMHVIRLGDRDIRVGTFPIGIDFKEFAAQTASDEVGRRTREIRENLPARHLLLGVDRLDYTKGIPWRLRAFADALARYPDLHKQITFIQVVVPSRTDIPRYADLKAQIEGLVSDINGRYTVDNWVPIHYVFRNLDRTDLLAHYRACQTGLITPLKDGMNLVAKEYCACDTDLNGVLILSEFAGAAAQLGRGALLVNPYDIRATADAIHQAFTMPAGQRRSRMRRMQRILRQQDIYWWVETFLQAAFAIHLTDVPEIEEYMPREDQASPEPNANQPNP